MPSCSLRISLKISEHDRPANGCGNHSSTHSLGLNDVSSKFTQHLDMCVCRGSGSLTDCAAHLQHHMHIRWIYVGRFLRYIHIYIFVVCPATGLSQVRLRLRLRFPLWPPSPRQAIKAKREKWHRMLSPSPSPFHSTIPTVDVPARSRGSLQWTPMRVTVLPQQRLSWMHSLRTHSVKIECLRCRSFSPYYGSSSTRFFFFYYAEKTGWDLLEGGPLRDNSLVWPNKAKIVMNWVKFLTYHSKHREKEDLRNVCL